MTETTEHVHVFRNEAQRAEDADFITQWVMIFCMGIMGFLMVLILMGQGIAEKQRQDTARTIITQNQKILNNQAIVLGNQKMGLMVLQGRCLSIREHQ
jgi:hypothetical protein